MNTFEFKKLCNITFGQALFPLGYSAVEVDSFLIRYESKNNYIEVSYDEREGEIFVYLGKMTNGNYVFNKDSEFTLNELLEECASKKTYKNLVFRESKDIENELKRLSNILSMVGKDILRGDVAIFAKLLNNRKKIMEQQIKDEHLFDKREKAEVAFRKGDYDSAVTLYREIETELTPVEKKKYTIALKRIKGA